MDRRMDGGLANDEFESAGPELTQHARVARGTIEHSPMLIERGWSVAEAAWAGTLDLESTSGAVYVIDDAGQILAVNSHACELNGTGRNELVGSAIADCLASDMMEPSISEDPRGVRFVPARAGVMAVHRSGARVSVELELVALDRRTIMVIARRSGVTTLDEDDIAAIVHDLKAPLSAIALEAHLLADRLTSSRLPTSLERIERNVAYMDHLVHELLDVCSLDAGRFSIDRRPVELCSLLESVLERTVANADRPRVTLEARRVMIDADDRRLERVFANLVENALKYTPRTAGVVVRVTESQTTVCIAVIDAGPGIPPEELAKLFDKYQRGSTGRSASGSGLGLYVARRIAEAHGGRIGVESVRGMGSRFFVELPKRVEAPLPRVLVVDDQPHHAAGLAEILGFEGYHAVTATTAAGALASIRQCRPDALVVDAVLRGPDGIELVQRLREEGIRIPTAIVSGLPVDHPRLAKAVRELGCAYVAKPIDLRRMLSLLGDLTHRS
jgi:PAS domain S-box-containing protein